MADWTKLVSTTIRDYTEQLAKDFEQTMEVLRILRGDPKPLPLPMPRRKEPKKTKRQLLAERQDFCSHNFSHRSRGQWKCEYCALRVSAEYAAGYEEGRRRGSD